MPYDADDAMSASSWTSGQWEGKRLVERWLGKRPLDDEEATTFPSEEDEAMREWRQEFPEQLRRAIGRIHTNLGHPQNSTLAKMISDAGGNEDMIKCATRYPCFVCKRMSRPRLRRPCVSFQEPDSSMTLCWLMCITGITKAVKFRCTQ